MVAPFRRLFLILANLGVFLYGSSQAIPGTFQSRQTRPSPPVATGRGGNPLHIFANTLAQKGIAVNIVLLTSSPSLTHCVLVLNPNTHTHAHTKMLTQRAQVSMR